MGSVNRSQGPPGCPVLTPTVTQANRIQTATRERIRNLHLHVPIWVPHETVGCQVGILKGLYLQVYFTRAFFISTSLLNPSARRLSLLIYNKVQTIKAIIL